MQSDISIRPLTLKNAYTSYKWRNDPKVWELTLNSPNKEISVLDEIDWIKKVIKEENSYRFGIYYNREYIGNVQLTNISKKSSYFGVFIGATDYWGRGIATKATKLLLEFAFLELQLNNVKLRVKKEHFKAIRLYKKIGFEEYHMDSDLIYMQIENKNIGS